MTRPNPNRPGMATDLTRWNRAGLGRVSYVDGDAAVWLEELRLALFGLYLRGQPVEDRLPERWRDTFLMGRSSTEPDDYSRRPDIKAPNGIWPTPAQLTAYADAVAWARLAPAPPPRAETRGQRSQRLMEQYNAPAGGDQAWDIARAFARAAHIVLGHAEAYANEGYLRTATQWDTLRRLAAVVNYQPGPPASATTLVALDLKAGTGVVEVGKGLAMKHTPLTGGAPLVFETLAPVVAHPDLNAARVEGWDVNATPLDVGTEGAPRPVTWLTGPKTAIAPGDLAVLTYGAGGLIGRARSVAEVDKGDCQAVVTLDDGVTAGPKTCEARLWIAPQDVRLGEPQTGNGKYVVEAAKVLSASVGDILFVMQNGILIGEADVVSVAGNAIVLRSDDGLPANIELMQLAPMAAGADGYITTGPNTDAMFYVGPQGVSKTYIFTGGNTMVPIDTEEGERVGWKFRPKGFASDRGYMHQVGAETVEAAVRPAAPQVLAGVAPDPGRTVTFVGKPPKSLASGSWFVARSKATGALQALRVVGVSVGTGLYHLLFHTDLATAPERTEFHGPMVEALLPLGHDRNPLPGAPAGVVALTGVAEVAQAVLKPGRALILSCAGEDALATITSLARGAGGVSVGFSSATDVSGWAAGDMVVRLNAVTVGHGEGKGPRLLGSGDAERPLQSFKLAVKDISHIPFSAAIAGVIPDIDVAVDGTVWPWRDYTDVTAEGAKAWSSALTEDGEITVQFRRRLPTGTNNVTVLRHRVGTGARGSGVAPLSFTKPMKKHPHVEAVHQPFATAGGADRESVAALRTSASSRLAANGRAVSLADFERLAAGHAAIWRARGEEMPGASRMRDIRLTVVPANGGALTQSLQDDLRPAILGKAVPGVRLSFAAFEALPLHIIAVVRADLTSYDAADVKAAAEAALGRAFGLDVRDFGQTVYVAEVLAALEAVPEVETAVVSSLGMGPGIDLTQPKPGSYSGPWPANVAVRDGAVAAIFAGARQVAFVPAAGQPYAQGTVSVTVEGLA